MGVLSFSSWYVLRAAEMQLTQIPPFNMWPYSLNRIMSSFNSCYKSPSYQLRTDSLGWAFILCFILHMPSLNFTTVSKEQHIFTHALLFLTFKGTNGTESPVPDLDMGKLTLCSCLDSFSLSHPINFGYKNQAERNA